MNKFHRLSQPGKIGKLDIKNRIIMASMAMFYAEKDGSVSDRQIAYYAERASGGVGLILTESAYTRHRAYPLRTEINDDKYIPGLSKLTGAVHDAGAKIFVQLVVGRGRGDEVECVSASDVPTPGTGVRPRALQVEEIERYVGEFGEGARRAREAGFDGINIHANGGYLVDEFLSPFTNRRTDEYGGDVEKRARFAIDLVKAVKRRAGSDYPVMFKLMAYEHIEGGLQLKDSIVICQLLEKAGLDAVEVVSGNFHMTDEWAIAPMCMPRCHNAVEAATLKRNIGIPVVLGGRVVEPDEAEQALLQDQADFVSFGRALLADPEWPNKALSGKSEDIRKCVACLHCMDDLFIRKKGATCTVNPALGEEGSFKISPASKPKRILVVGGGPAGMKAAQVSALRGHKVTLWEKTGKLGGLLKVAVKPPHKAELGSIAEYLTAQIDKLGISVQLGKEADIESVSKFAPDTVIIATGASPVIPNIPGANGNNVFTAVDILDGKAEPGKEVIIIGGGLVGCETAEFLTEKGVQVTILEVLERVAGTLNHTVRKMLLRRLDDAGVIIMTGVEPVEITEQGVKAISGGSKMFFPCDTVVIAVGMKSNNALAGALDGKVSELYSVGDSAQPRLIFEAIYEGARTAAKI